MRERGSEPPPELDDRSVPFVERWIAPFLREPMLWPVAIVVVAHAVAFLAPVLLLALRDRRLAALGALTGLLVLSGAAVRSELARLHRPGVVCGLLGATWALSVVAAITAHRTGIF
jgi:Ni/Fe-hydrogenase subunit HybB-like protein